MTDALNEQLSACLDGELPAAELDLLLKRVEREAELRAAIGRYSLIGEAMRAERPAIASRDFASKVMAAVAAEPAREESATPTSVAPKRLERPAAAVRAPRISPAALRYLRPAAGMAIAAGVAAVAVLSMQPVGQPEVGSVSTPLVAANQPAANEPSIAVTNVESSYVVPTSTSNNAFIPATRLTNYVVAHGEFSSPLGRRSVWSGVLADDEEAQALEAGEAEVKISISNHGAPER
ncbi:sigma-E factor negative regulatory protein [Steroidobacter sp. S1-65]|uniref:Sigma-E factor negative regulatory protein n=1 Tax=Steroidobacter gossypii TaxID=2805490 RepID=A0ABS1WVY3_9GAMM|nr:sigma-E factor negative regulatory protein [Steroidobacter gossypii]MBM0105119.1 sigma-E factor negative regulatory protein [Steroidobacter gossypii]